MQQGSGELSKLPPARARSILRGKNETLFDDLLTALGEQRLVLEKSFVIGVNTICYCHRARKQLDCARDMSRLVALGGVCVVIVMNGRFPVFRSKLNNAMRAKSRQEE